MRSFLRRVSGAGLFLLFSTTVQAVELEASVGWGEPLLLSTNLEGEVVSANPRPGQRLHKGELLVQLDATVARARLAQSRAALEHQELLLSEAKSELERSQELYDRTLLSNHDLDVARIAHAAANSSYLRAVAEVSAAERALALHRIVAPLDCMVVERFVQSAAVVNGRLKSSPLYSLVATGTRLLRTSAASSQVGAIQVGDTVAIRVAGRGLSGTVAAMHVTPSKEATTAIDILFTPDGDDSAKIGQEAKVILP